MGEDMTVPIGEESFNRFGFMIGAYNDGLRCVLKAKRLLH